MNTLDEAENKGGREFVVLEKPDQIPEASKMLGLQTSYTGMGN